MAQSYLITSDVVRELRDKKGREVMREAELQLGLPGDGGLEGAKAGFTIREPTAESVAKGENRSGFLFIRSVEIEKLNAFFSSMELRIVSAFARKTGDIAVLSTADIRVLALCLTLELEENGTWRVRDTPGQILAGKPPVVETEAVAVVVKAIEGLEIVEDDSTKGETAAEEEEEGPVASTSSLAPPSIPANDVVVDEDGAQDSNQVETNTEMIEVEGEDAAGNDEDDNVSEAGSDDSHLSSSSWITPDNLVAHKVKDLGLFTPPTPTDVIKPPKSIMKAAVLTGDFAMQNVALQMGLNVLGSGGKRVREVRTWVLRCHGCFK